MITLNDIKTDESAWFFSITKLFGKQIKDVEFTLNNESGNASIDIFRIVFEDNSAMVLQGEHDVVYAYSEEQPNGDQETLERLYEEQEEEWN